MKSLRSTPLLTSVTFALIALCGCIHNDIPYPRIVQTIREISVEGENAPALIDSAAYTATVYLDEDVDIRHVRFTKFVTTPGAKVSPDPLEDTYDLSHPKVFTLKKYQTYQWVVKASQTIERYFKISGQIGESTIDEAGHRIIVYVPMSANLSNLTLTDIKLGPTGITTLSPSVVPGPIDLSRPLRIAVTAHGMTEDWTIFTEKSELLVETQQVDAWSEVIWAYGVGPADVRNGFQYRESTEGDWHDVPASSVTQEEGSGSFSCCIPHLKPLTTYVVRTVSGENIGNEVEVTTQSTELIPDGSFDQWWKNGNIWCPWNEGGFQFWDTGNTGAATLGQSNVVPSDDTPTGSGKSAKLETKFVGIGIIGKLAAGSIYTGKFAKVDGTNGILEFGKPWEVRPTELHGYFKYTTAPINYASAEYKYLLNRPDSCHIYVALADWTTTFQIRTNPNNRQLFNPNSAEIIAYGEMIVGADTGTWREFTIKLNYRSTSRKPRYLQITCAASKYGDFFTGGTGATLYVDQLSFSYDIP